MTEQRIPLHTRSISIRLSGGKNNDLHAHGRIVDIRKRGVFPLAHHFQGPGIIHDMEVDMEIGVPDLAVKRLTPKMSAIPYPPSARTGHQSCRDTMPNVEALAGISLDGNYGDHVLEGIGGPKGCFHVFTLMRLMGPSLQWAIEKGAGLNSTVAIPLFDRSIIIDGFRAEGFTLALRGTLTDVHYGTEENKRDLRVQKIFEALAEVRMEVPNFAILEAHGQVRSSGPGWQARGEWTSDQPLLEKLLGLHIRKGFTAMIEKIFAPERELEPLKHLIFMIAPTGMQCMPSLVEELSPSAAVQKGEKGRVVAINSCYMWREDGPLVSEKAFHID